MIGICVLPAAIVVYLSYVIVHVQILKSLPLILFFPLHFYLHGSSFIENFLSSVRCSADAYAQTGIVNTR